MKVYLRGERRWQKNLAREMFFEMSELPEKNVTNKNDNIISTIKFYNKKWNFPPVEWLVDVTDKNQCDMYIETGSRVLKTNRKYITYVENGVGVLSYNIGKNNLINRMLLKKNVEKENFKGFVFYSEASKKSFENCFSQYDFLMNKVGPVIYPLVEVNIKKNSDLKKCIGFCSSNFYLKGGGEVLEVAKEMKDIKFDIITNISSLTKDTLNSIPENVNLIDFNLSNDEFMHHATSRWDIYLHVTFFDTVPLTPLEMIKCGIPVIATNTFAIPEYIINEKTGLIINNPRNVFDFNYLPKEDVYLGNYIRELSISNVPDRKMISDIKGSLLKMYDEYDFYVENVRVFNSNYNCFSADYIKKQWQLYLEDKV